MLQDDPAFLPDFFLPNLDVDLSILSASTQGSSGKTSILSAHSHHSSQSSTKTAEGSTLGLVIPTSDTGNAGDLGGFAFPRSEGASAQRTSRVEDAVLDEEAVFFPNPDFGFDVEGNMVNLSTEQQQVGADAETILGSLRGESVAATGAKGEQQKAREPSQQEACISYLPETGFSLIKAGCCNDGYQSRSAGFRDW